MPKTWRDQIPVHPACKLFPPMPPDELRALGEDILKNKGLNSAIVLWRADRKGQAQLLDGRNRLDAMELVGFQMVDDDGLLKLPYVEEVEPPTDPYAYVISANVHRRHLSAEQKRDVISNLILAHPNKSDRQIAGMLKVSHHTVASVRAEMEGRGQIAHAKTRTDSQGREQPARRRRAPSQLGNAPAGDTAPAVRDDVGANSTGENGRKDAEIEDLHRSKRMLEIKVADLENELRQQAAKPVSGSSVTEAIELLRQIITEHLPKRLAPLSQRAQQQAKKLFERLDRDLSELVELRRVVAKHMPDVPPPDGLDVPPFLDRTHKAAQ
jgi:hypothetical protein